jgi:putative membrane protein
LIAFSYFLSWIFKKFEYQTIALLTGFILGSLGMIWPWKTPQYVMDLNGLPLLKKGKMIVESYQWNLPEKIDTEFLFALLFIVLGILLIWITETLASKQNK